MSVKPPCTLEARIRRGPADTRAALRLHRDDRGPDGQPRRTDAAGFICAVGPPLLRRVASWPGIRDAVEALRKSGVQLVFFESPGTAHEWQTWRRALHDLAPRLFQSTSERVGAQ